MGPRGRDPDFDGQKADHRFSGQAVKVEMKKRVLVAMSGGVDSSAALLLLKNEGYEVTGATFRLHDAGSDRQTHTCCSVDDVDDARRVCIKLGADHLVFGFKQLFEQTVISHFVEEYLAGKMCIRDRRKTCPESGQAGAGYQCG